MCSYGCCVYLRKVNEDDVIYLIVYIDDMLLTCRDMN